jgi:ABC-2 type transport system ATP-binding protein
MLDPIIKVENLTKKYGDFEAVKGLSFEVYAGEIFGLLGPNGAGKSTTLEIIETLREKTNGKVIVNGIDIENDPAAVKKIIGVQLQTAGFYPGLNLVELLDLFAGLYNEEIDPLAILDSVNLRDKAKAKFKELSGGQKARRNLWDLIRSIRDNGTTVVITTHYMDEAEILCDRVAIVDSGKLIAINTPDQLIDDLVAGGFEKPKEVKQANLEDVFINLTGHALREA